MPSTTTLSIPARALLLGVFTGARSATPLAVLALQHDRPSLQGAWQQWPVFRSPVGRGALVASAAGELVADKLPVTPSRLKPGALLGRVTAGAIAGLVIGSVGGSSVSRLQTAVLGGVGAVIGSYAGYLGRTALGWVSGLPDPVVALVEDAITVAGATAVVTAD
ncbi:MULTISPECIES: DUF4126 family protein [unclassified Curtobacterium]|uniref:DUF4126 family protein n=1 Tax=unclassified Curtobacterium TaxID=257496 RepID=UPI000DA7071E|nr:MULTISPECIES: DUF4126 family protein [unclassified Curtobacterium]WIB66814.1 DUF4126 family protein [Curtobacterium sp. MCBD17_035]WIE53959.1 DUF4126 family protein [Curtobacterium sp. MCBD17_003]